MYQTNCVSTWVSYVPGVVYTGPDPWSDKSKVLQTWAHSVYVILWRRGFPQTIRPTDFCQVWTLTSAVNRLEERKGGSSQLVGMMVRHLSGEEDRGRLSGRTVTREGHVGPRGAVTSWVCSDRFTERRNPCSKLQTTSLLPVFIQIVCNIFIWLSWCILNNQKQESIYKYLWTTHPLLLQACWVQAGIKHDITIATCEQHICYHMLLQSCYSKLPWIPITDNNYVVNGL